MTESDAMPSPNRAATTARLVCWLRGHVDHRRPTDSGFTLCDRCGKVLL